MTERNNTCVASAMQRRHQNFITSNVKPRPLGRGGCQKFETLLLRLLKKYKYKPKKEFAGQTECFSNISPIRERFNIFDVFGIDSFKRAV